MTLHKTDRKLTRLAVICGGTGGHFYPGLSVARALKERGGEPRIFIGGHKVGNQRRAAESYGIEVVEISSARVPKNPFSALAFLVKISTGFAGSRRHLRKFHPDAVLGMGSFTSVPMGLAAASLSVPLFLHDGNARVGRANRFLSRFARLTMTAFPAVNPSSIRSPHACAGMPLRPELVTDKLEKPDAVRRLGERVGAAFDPARPLVAVFGGSQGAATLNRSLPAALSTIRGKRLQAVHLAGAGKKDEVLAGFATADLAACAVLESFDDMALLYAAADLVVCRSGGSTVAELACFGTYAVLVPFPNAADNHQMDNARFYVDSGGGEILENADCTPERMTALLQAFLANLDSYAAAGAMARSLARPAAAAEVLTLIEGKL